MWYDIFCLFYDRALELAYRPFRNQAVDALMLQPGARVLDLPCGTGQSLDLIVDGIGPTGQVLGVDQSGGMLKKARSRAANAGWSNVAFCQAGAGDVAADLLVETVGHPNVDGVICSLGLTAFPDWERVFDSVYQLVRPGRRFVIFDVFAAERNRHSRAVELVARADISRPVWHPLRDRCGVFERAVVIDDAKKFGGELYVAAGTVS